MLLASLVLVAAAVHASPYLSESWTLLTSDRPSSPKCVPIPSNLTLCYGIQYTEMRLPNVLEHETLDEVIQLGNDFRSLVQLNCDADTQLFLCSVFAPVCLASVDKAILPCRSLCEKVRQGCESRMKHYGFPWPEMLKCDRYPEDDMCIRRDPDPSREMPPREGRGLAESRERSCSSCSQVPTYENLVDHFCRSQLVLKAKLSKVAPSHVSVRNGRSLKRQGDRQGDRRRSVSDVEIQFADESGCPCNVTNSYHSSRFLIMANKAENGAYVANLIVPWNREKAFKKAIREFRQLNCKSLGREIRESASRRPHYMAMRTHNIAPVPFS